MVDRHLRLLSIARSIALIDIHFFSRHVVHILADMQFIDGER